jgi:hypothetical protein
MAGKKRKTLARKKVENTVYVLEYVHEHGNDLIFCPTKEAVVVIEANLIVEWIDDIKSVAVRDRILADIADGNFSRAVDEWLEYQSEQDYPESFELHTFDGLSALDEKDVKQHAKDRIAELAHNEEL